MREFIPFKKIRNQQGFTLIELMIVAAIISILATLALPRLEQFQAKAKFSEGEVNVKVLRTLIHTALLDSNTLGSFLTGYGEDNGSGISATSCNIPNDIGFVLNSCEKVNFTYGFSSIGTAIANSLLQAAAEGPRIYSGCDPTSLVGMTVSISPSTYKQSQALFWTARVSPTVAIGGAVGGRPETVGEMFNECKT